MGDWLMMFLDPLYLIVDLALDSPLAALLVTSALGAIIAATWLSNG